MIGFFVHRELATLELRLADLEQYINARCNAGLEVRDGDEVFDNMIFWLRKEVKKAIRDNVEGVEIKFVQGNKRRSSR